MAIVVFVSDALDGLGDLLFGVKTANFLRTHLSPKGYRGEIFLVSTDTGARKLLQLTATTPDIHLYSIDGFRKYQRTSQIFIDYYVEVGGIDLYAHSKTFINLPAETPVLIIPEYSPTETEIQSVQILFDHYTIRQQTPPMLIKTGFQPEHDEHGIMIDTTPFQLSQEQHWHKIESFLPFKVIRNANKNYSETTDLFFEYSHNKNQLFHANSCQHYLTVLQLYTEHNNKNQDVISVGKKTKTKKAAVESLLPILQQNNFTTVLIVDLATGKSTTLFEKQTDAPKVFRLLHVSAIHHACFTAFLAVSGDLVGLTGDQSLSEAISGGKIPVYECLNHKSTMANAFSALLHQVSNQDSTVSELADDLFKLDLTVVSNQENLRRQIQDRHTLEKLQSAIHTISKEYNLCDALSESIKIKTPLDLTNNELKQYAELIEKKLQQKAGQAAKLFKVKHGSVWQSDANDDPDIPLFFSALKFRNKSGFYILGRGDNSIIGKGGWSKVKLGYYCDEQMILNTTPLAIKIEKTKSADKAKSELMLFSQVHQLTEMPKIYIQGLRLDTDKTYTVRTYDKLQMNGQ